ncbi:hypothetical protein ShirakiTB12_15010 [Priestia megaterium]|uniref:Uncharacterized protein n=1 Tax=Priestia megaterium TaxID=1404 RepID=A0AAX6BH09_PRIMG|nr:hypothetical protein ShirakiTB12_15010 [Priestia megaterium]
MRPFVQMVNVPFLIPLKTNNKQKAEAEISLLLFVYFKKNYKNTNVCSIFVL